MYVCSFVRSFVQNNPSHVSLTSQYKKIMFVNLKECLSSPKQILRLSAIILCICIACYQVGTPRYVFFKKKGFAGMMEEEKARRLKNILLLFGFQISMCWLVLRDIGFL